MASPAVRNLLLFGRVSSASAPPFVVVSAEVSPELDFLSDVLVTFSDAPDLDTLTQNDPSGFTVYADGEPVDYFYSGGAPGTHLIRLHPDIITIQPGQVVTMDYTPGIVRSVNGRFLEAFSGFPVANNLE